MSEGIVHIETTAQERSVIRAALAHFALHSEALNAKAQGVGRGEGSEDAADQARVADALSRRIQNIDPPPPSLLVPATTATSNMDEALLRRLEAELGGMRMSAAAAGWRGRFPEDSLLADELVRTAGATQTTTEVVELSDELEVAYDVVADRWERGHLERSEAVAVELQATLAKLPTPDGHRWKFYDRHELTWYMGGPGHKISAYLEPDSKVRHTADQLHAEIRVFLDEPRAALFFGRGPMIVGKHESLLPAESAHSRAGSYAELFEKVRATINPLVDELAMQAEPEGMKP